MYECLFLTLCVKILSFSEYYGKSVPYLATDTWYNGSQALSLGRAGCLNDLPSGIAFY